MTKKILFVLVIILLFSNMITIVYANIEDDSNYVYIDNHIHTYGEWRSSDIKNHSRACILCGITESELHNWYIDTTNSISPTETEEGYTTYRCSTVTCYESYTDILPKLTTDNTYQPEFPSDWFPIINQIQNNKPEPEKENDTTTTPEPDTYTCPYKDISGHWAEDIIKFIDELGLIDGITATQFQPNEPMTREMFVTAVARLAGVESDYVSWAINNGILLGYGNGEYGLTDTVTREQMAVFFLRYFEKMGINTAELRVKDAYTFADNENISDWAAGAVYEIQMIGLIQGKENNLFDPQGTATRAEAATVLYNLIQTIMNNN